jgi:hypothetical protein
MILILVFPHLFSVRHDLPTHGSSALTDQKRKKTRLVELLEQVKGMVCQKRFN